MLQGQTGPGAEPEAGRKAAEPAVGSETKPPPGGWAAGAKVLPPPLTRGGLQETGPVLRTWAAWVKPWGALSSGRWPRTAWWEQSRTEGCFKEMVVARALCRGDWPRAGAQLWGEQRVDRSMGEPGRVGLAESHCHSEMPSAKAGPPPAPAPGRGTLRGAGLRLGAWGGDCTSLPVQRGWLVAHCLTGVSPPDLLLRPCPGWSGRPRCWPSH